jgi:hypothetical protein
MSSNTSRHVVPANYARLLVRKSVHDDPQAWLQQFTTVDETLLGRKQCAFVKALRRLYPTGLVGHRRDTGHLCFYAADAALGKFCGLIPKEGAES